MALPADLSDIAATQGLRPQALLAWLRYAQVCGARFWRLAPNYRRCGAVARAALPAAPLRWACAQRPRRCVASDVPVGLRRAGCGAGGRAMRRTKP